MQTPTRVLERVREKQQGSHDFARCFFFGNHAVGVILLSSFSASLDLKAVPQNLDGLQRLPPLREFAHRTD